MMGITRTQEISEFWEEWGPRLRRAKGLHVLTPEEADAELAVAPEVPLREEEIAAIVALVRSSNGSHRIEATRGCNQPEAENPSCGVLSSAVVGDKHQTGARGSVNASEWSCVSGGRRRTSERFLNVPFAAASLVALAVVGVALWGFRAYQCDRFAAREYAQGEKLYAVG